MPIDSDDLPGGEGTAVKKVLIRIEGSLDLAWTEWFDGLVVENTSSGETILTGVVADQAALYGLIGKLRDLGVKLLAITFKC